MDYLTEYISKLDIAPIIMGHSFGGTFAQLLVGNGLGAAGVSIDGAAVKGINAMPLSEVRSVLPVLDNPANINKASALTPKQFHYAFTNAQDDAVSQQAYDRYSAPTPAKVLFQGGFAALTPHAATTFNFADDDRAPLLFISGGSDHILPPVVQDHNYKKCAKHSTAIAAHSVPRPGPLHLRRARLGGCRRLRPLLGPSPHRRRTRAGDRNGRAGVIRRPAKPLAPGEKPNGPRRPLPTRQSRPFVILNEWWMTLAAYPLSQSAGPRRRGRCTGASANSTSWPTWSAG